MQNYFISNCLWLLCGSFNPTRHFCSGVLNHKSFLKTYCSTFNDLKPNLNKSDAMTQTGHLCQDQKADSWRKLYLNFIPVGRAGGNTPLSCCLCFWRTEAFTLLSFLLWHLLLLIWWTINGREVEEIHTRGCKHINSLTATTKICPQFVSNIWQKLLQAGKENFWINICQTKNQSWVYYY